MDLEVVDLSALCAKAARRYFASTSNARGGAELAAFVEFGASLPEPIQSVAAERFKDEFGRLAALN